MPHTAAQAEITALPGQRILHGQVYTFDLDMLNDHHAKVACEAAPADLGSVPVADLGLLHYRALHYSSMTRGAPEARALVRRVEAERHAREPGYARAFGHAAPVQLMAAE